MDLRSDLSVIEVLLKDYTTEGSSLSRTVMNVVQLLDMRRDQVRRLEEEVRRLHEDPWIDVGFENRSGGSHVWVCPKDVRSYVEDLRDKVYGLSLVCAAVEEVCRSCGDLGVVDFPKILASLPNLIAAWSAYPDGENRSPITDGERAELDKKVSQSAPWLLRLLDKDNPVSLV